MRASQRLSTRIALVTACLALSYTAVSGQQAPPPAEIVAERTAIALPDDAPVPASIAPVVPIGAPALSPWRSTPLKLGLYGTFAVLQALDTVTTLQALRDDRSRELNPLMAGLTSHPAAFIATKGAIAFSTLYLVHKISKDHPKAAIWLTLAINAG